MDEAKQDLAMSGSFEITREMTIGAGNNATAKEETIKTMLSYQQTTSDVGDMTDEARKIEEEKMLAMMNGFQLKEYDGIQGGQ